jgi:hypothetical protein
VGAQTANVVGGISRRWVFVAGETALRRRNPIYPATLSSATESMNYDRFKNGISEVYLISLNGFSSPISTIGSTNLSIIKMLLFNRHSLNFMDAGSSRHSQQ